MLSWDLTQFSDQLYFKNFVEKRTSSEMLLEDFAELQLYFVDEFPYENIKSDACLF